MYIPDLHPPASGLPLASALLLIAVEIFAVLFKYRTLESTIYALRYTSVVACVIGVIAAFTSGYQASSLAIKISASAEDALAWHHTLSKGVLVASILLGAALYLSQVAVHARKVFVAAYYILLLVFVLSTVFVGKLGGELVFRHGVNVKVDVEPMT
jgi:uncharacterized membrane protein